MSDIEPQKRQVSEDYCTSWLGTYETLVTEWLDGKIDNDDAIDQARTFWCAIRQVVIRRVEISHEPSPEAKARISELRSELRLASFDSQSFKHAARKSANSRLGGDDITVVRKMFLTRERHHWKSLSAKAQAGKAGN